MSPNEKIFIENLRNLRKASKLSQKEMAAEIEVKYSTYRAWEQFRNFPKKLIYLLRIASFFQYTVEELFNGYVRTNIAA